MRTLLVLLFAIVLCGASLVSEASAQCGRNFRGQGRPFPGARNQVDFFFGFGIGNQFGRRAFPVARGFDQFGRPITQFSNGVVVLGHRY